MKHSPLDQRMKSMEQFGQLRLPPEGWAVVRADGRGFSRLTEQRFQKPFDPRFHEAMVAAARAMLEELSGLYAYTESDEISLLLPRDNSFFSGRLEKLVSVAAGIASATFTHHIGAPAHFDARVWLGPSEEAVVDYFRWRQADALRCSLNGWCYWTLRQAGQSAGQATAALDGRTFDEKRALLERHGVQLDALPGWQRQGVGLYPETFLKRGFDPRSREEVFVARRRVRVEETLPTGDAYARFLTPLLSPSVADRP